MAGDAPGDFVCDFEAVEEVEEARDSDVRAEVAGAVV